MRDALKNFILALFSVAFLIGIGWLILNNNALAKPEPHPFPHPFLDALAKGGMVIAYQGNTQNAPPNSLKAFADAAPDQVLWVDVRPTGEGTWVAYAPKALPENERGWISYMHDADVFKGDSAFGTKYQGQGYHVETLAKVLATYPNRFFVINMQDYKDGGKEQIVKTITDAKAGERALISSPEDGILRDLREAQPTWLFGTSRAQVTRLIMLSQLYLASSAPMRGDVFVWDPAIPANRMNDRIWAEIGRRKMKSVLPEALVKVHTPNAVIR